MNTIKKSGLLLAALLMAILAITSIAVARESEGSAQTPANNEDALAIALAHLNQNKGTLGLTAADLAEAKVSDTTVSRLSGVTTIYLAQQLDGVEVFNGLINISIMPNGDVLTVGNRFVPNLAGAVTDKSASLSAEQAVNAAADHLGLTISEPLQTIEQASGSAQETLFSSGGISQEAIPAKLVYDASGKTPRLAWNVIIYQLDSQHWWNVRVDANSGEILSQNDWVVSEDFLAQVAAAGHAEGTAATTVNNAASQGNLAPNDYSVYAWPVESPNYAVPAPPADARTIENNPAGDAVPNAHPFGWHSDNVTNWTNTQGNNVDSHKGVVRFDCGATLDCTTGLDLTMDPTVAVNVDAATVNLFYWNNIIHDVWYQYGFDEASGNFQNNNNGMGGLGNDRVNANAQAPGNCNANFGTPADGSQPTMNMFICDIATPSRDGDLDNGVIAHEYGHGISNRLTGGPSNVSCLNNLEQMGEGWSDFIGLIMTIEAGDTGPDPRGIGTWLLGEGPGGPGVRNLRYSTDFSVNNHTYDDIIVASGVHDVGEVWATMLWEMTWELVANGVSQNGLDLDIYNGTGGNNLAMQLVMEGMKLQPCSPGFVDGRDAILAADVALNSGENACTIWEAFARRGLGFSADQGSSNSRTDGTEAFDMPPACMTLDVTPTSIDICQGDTAVYTVSVGTSFTPPVDMSATGNPSPSTAIFNPDPVVSVPSTTDLTIGNTGSVAAGSHTINIAGTDGNVSDDVDVELNVSAGVPGATTLVAPINGATGVASQPTFEWTAVASANSYYLEVATDAGFTNIVYTATEAGTTHAATSALNPDTQHYWRVTAENPCGSGTASSVFTFRTASILTACSAPNVAIPDSGSVSDTITIPGSGNATDVDVYINATHTWVGDLAFNVNHNATDAFIIDRPGRPPGGPGSPFGCSGDDYDVTVNDEGVDGDIESQCANAPAIFGDRVGGDPVSSSLLAVYDGMDVNGDWTLTASDNAGGDTGTLVEWCVVVSVPPTSGPGIDLEKTVSTDGSCGTTDTLTVEYGTDVTYCYDVVNTGDVTFTMHTLVDDQLGNILTDFPYVLAPGAAVFVTETVALTQTTTNVATWTATDGVDTVADSDSATVTVVVTPTIDVAPASVSSTQAPDTTDTHTLTISNIGTGDLDWTIDEVAPTNLPALPSASRDSYVAGLYAPSFGLAPADGIAAVSKDAAAVPQAILGNTAYAVEAVNGFYTAFDLDVPETLPNLNPYSPIAFPGAGEVVNGYAYVVDGTTMVQLDLATGAPLGSTPVTTPPGTQNYSGMALDPTTGDVYLSSCDISTSILYTLDIGSGTATQVGTITNSPCTIGIAIDGNGDLYGYDIVNDSFLSIDKATAAGTIIGLLGYDANFGQGMGYDPLTDQIYLAAFNNTTFQPELRTADLNTGNTTLVGVLGSTSPGGLAQLPWLGMELSSGGICDSPSDIPWLSVSPASGTTPMSASSEVDVAFDSTGYATGVYTGTLCINSNDALTPLVTVPVTMTVITPTYGVMLSGDQALSGDAGTMVTYTVSVTNLGDVDDDIDLTAVSANGWTVDLSVPTVSLDAGASTDVLVTVHVPAGASDGDMDDVTVTATSQGDSSMTDTAVLTTTATVPGYTIYLPIILKP